MRIAIDLDGVLIDLIGRFCEIYNKKYNDYKTPSDICNWGFYNDWGITEVEVFDIFDNIKMQKCPVVDRKAEKYMRKLMEKGYHLDIVTAKPRADDMREDIVEKLEMMGIYEGTHYNELEIIQYYPQDGKALMEYNIFVDDSPNLAESIGDYKYGLIQYQLLYDQPWNWGIQCEKYDNVKRIKNWKGVYRTLKGFK